VSTAWPHYRERVTVCDLLDSGACYSGVRDWIEEHRGLIAGDTEKFRRNEYIARSAHADGYGDGSGYGSGDGES